MYKCGFTVVGSLVKRKPFWGFFREAWINLFWKFLKSVKSRVEKAYLNVSLKFLNWPKFYLRTKTKLPKTRNRAIVIWNSSLSKIWNLTTLRKALVGCSFLIPGADKQDYEYRTSLAHIFNQIELFQFELLDFKKNQSFSKSFRFFIRNLQRRYIELENEICQAVIFFLNLQKGGKGKRGESGTERKYLTSWKRGKCERVKGD